MPVKLDIIEGSGLVFNAEQTRITRVAFVSDIDTTQASSVLVRASRAGGMPQRGDRHPAVPTCLVTGHDVKPTSDRDAFVFITYETPKAEEEGGGGGGSPKWSIRDSTSLSSVSTQLVPKTFEPLIVTYGFPQGDPSQPGYNSIVRTEKKQLTLPYAMPMRRLVFTGTIEDRPPALILDAIGTVNKVKWQGLETGYWLFDGFETFTTNNKTYSVTVGFSTKIHEDWSQLGYMRDDRGQPLPVSADKQAELRKKKYAQGLDNSVNGLLKVGLYPESDMLAIFGI